MSKPAAKDITDVRAKTGRGKLRDALEGATQIVRPAILELPAPGCTSALKNRTGHATDPVVPITSIGTPNAWFCGTFKLVAEKYGAAINEERNRSGIVVVKYINESFLAATFGPEGDPENPIVYLTGENRFYEYDPAIGIFVFLPEPIFGERISQRLLRCSSDSEGVDDSRLKFKLRDSARTKGVVERARGVLCVPDNYFRPDEADFIACANGMLRLQDLQLLPFSPAYRRRNKLGVAYIAEATCPTFLETLLSPALDADDLDLLQRWCGQALTGINFGQRIMMISGTAGSGKGTLIRILRAIIGGRNVGSLRPRHLADRFEIGRHLDKTLLYGADVSENFLSVEGASALKSLTGGDPVTAERKGSNATPELVCRFNVVVTANMLPTIKLEGDVEAWRRRLLVLIFGNEQPEVPIFDLPDRIIEQEGSGVLNWMLEGQRRGIVEGWRFPLTPRQQARVNSLLAESDSEGEFVRLCLVRDPEAVLTVEAAYVRYVEFCQENDWREYSRRKFGVLLNSLVAREVRLQVHHDILDETGSVRRGWRGLRCN